MRSKTNTAPPTTIDEYLSRVSDDKRSALQRLRETILRVIPMAEECISYQMPAFRYDGRVLVYFGAAANHCAFYPGGMVKNFKDELDGYETSKGTIRFQPERPLPASLVHRIVKARLAQNAARASKAKQAKPKQAKPKRTKPKQAKANQAKPKRTKQTRKLKPPKARKAR